MTATSPCAPWATEVDLPESCDLTMVKPEALDDAFIFASDILYNLTRRRWPGECNDTYLPFCNGCCYASATALPTPIRTPAGFINATCCGEHDHIKLPASDVRSITHVKINGVAVSSSEYGLRDRRYLYAKRQADGSLRSWPCWQDLTVTPPEFEIAYVHGAAPPRACVIGCALLAWEFAVLWTPDCASTCRLPRHVQSITRGGTTMAIVDPFTIFDQGKTGIEDIDLLIASYLRGETHKRAWVGRPGSRSSTIRQ